MCGGVEWNVEVWRCGGMEVWSGGVEVWRCNVWNCGGVDVEVAV